MAFNFQPRADSSDEEGGGIDLSAWKTGSGSSVRKSTANAEVPLVVQRAPVAPMQAQDDSDSGDLLATDVVADHAASTSKRKRTTPARSPPRMSFTSINLPRPLAPTASAELDMERSTASGLGNGEDEDDSVLGASRPLIPILTPVDLSEEEVLDFTAGDDVVRRVLRKYEGDAGEMSYEVEFEDWSKEKITFEQLLAYQNGQEALQDFTDNPPESDDLEVAPPVLAMSSTRPDRRQVKQAGFVSTVDAVPVSGDEAESGDEIEVSHARNSRRKQDRSQYIDPPEADQDPDEEFEEDDEDDGRRRGSRLRRRNNEHIQTTRSTRSNGRRSALLELEGDADSSDDNFEFLTSDIPGARKRRHRTSRTQGERDFSDDGIGFQKSKRQRTGERQSGRSTRHQGGMTEIGENDIFREESDQAARVPVKPKAVGAREVFKSLPRNDDFRMRHAHECEVCGQGQNFAPLIYCQGCTLSYHKSCLGHRTNREHLVTKVGDGDFVLQCRRCVAFPRKKDPVAPDQGKCSDCHQHGNACKAFRPRRTTAQEQKERDDNDGVDPNWEVHESRINNADNVLFRCMTCWRAFHFEHLPSRSDMMEIDSEADAEQRFREYSRDWKCKECLTAPAKVSGIIAWKPTEEDNYDPAIDFEMIDEDEKAYLVRWEGMSYFRASWMPGAWVWGTTAHMMRKAFAKREESRHPKMRTEDAIPEDYLRTDIVLDIEFTSIVDIRTEEIDKARIREIKKALIKYKGLGYEDAVWESPPSPDDGDRWTDFVVAYNDWVLGRYVRPPKKALVKQLEKARSQDFSKLEKKGQPDNLEGGELMQYQVEGLNWLYYKWFTQKNAILADEMGLGKTIQIIGFLTTLVQDWNCFPFLIVVPNSTCPNWRREIKRWAPSLRVVAYYGSRESRDLAYRYELFPEGSKDLRCHIVVTSYDAASDENCRKFFRSVPWQGLVVDEGQRLKNDKNQLYAALGALKAPFKILLTGTPLQNNVRELFNLLQFLDDSHHAAALEEQYADLDQNKITEMHDLIRPFFLRRTKAQVLTFLPPMAQIIVPVSMTIVQKKLYRTILAKNPDLIKAIFSTESESKKVEKGSLSNILMQLRKCLCHPFVYNSGIEERNVSISASHRNLVDASAKLKLLELLLPKLRERGHRVLIFSQFLGNLDIVEDFMDGMMMRYQRLDGNIDSLTKQKRIDQFNAPDSPLFAFLLSTRAGGVGINLASADTVIILDPDFNPHQDIQALSRAHRIGQKKKVLCFQIVTRASVEERIMQIGRKKLALEHVLIQEMDADDADQNDLVSVLRHGANELFQDNGEQDVNYDSASVERLLDRSHMEDTQAGVDKSAETQWSYARVWANDANALEDADMVNAPDQAPDPGVWVDILKERERIAAQEAADKAEAFGRGRRARGNVDYAGDKAPEGSEGLDLGPLKPDKKIRNGDESDTDFRADDSGDDDEQDGGEELLDADELKHVEVSAKQETGRKNKAAPSFHRAIVTPYASNSNGHGLLTPPDTTFPQLQPNANPPIDGVNCLACRTFHPVGSCPLKVAGVEHCNLCGMAHFGQARVCPHIQSETQVRAMLEALKYSKEPEHLITEARRYLRGLKGNLVQLKKQKEAKEHAAREQEAAFAYQQARAPVRPY